ncbi:uncharacterized protein DUF3108 [Marinilabilia salmonicolor]|jgi:hypothetical protein|uniref:DUF3108 domain-containing protein n=1 Tax=Marinilabilia salmonicolor TaxID=989 RepID=UPI000D084D43|nr:DUF3108 domain-containing protein [Marinilabilia salmonicolor]PRY99774.1 uncharacterized protein DUF3108 [Marinilabilia salmonicolor]
MRKRLIERFDSKVMRKLLVFFLLVGWSSYVSGQCYDQIQSFAPGEEVTYHAYYNWGFVWINAGEVTFGVDKDQWRGEDALHFRSYGATYKAYDIFFKVRDSLDVWVNPLSMEPLEFHRRTNEGSYTAHHHYLFDSSRRKVNASISKRGESYRDTIFDWPECSFDLLSMVYQARKIDFSRYEEGDRIPISLIVDGEVHNLYIRYHGREAVKDRSGREFNCLKFSPLLVEGTIFEEGEKMFVWVTDDKNRIPIVVEAKILVGSVKAVFVGAKGLKHPMNSKIVQD